MHNGAEPPAPYERRDERFVSGGALKSKSNGDKVECIFFALSSAFFHHNFSCSLWRAGHHDRIPCSAGGQQHPPDPSMWRGQWGSLQGPCWCHLLTPHCLHPGHPTAFTPKHFPSPTAARESTREVPVLSSHCFLPAPGNSQGKIVPAATASCSQHWAGSTI